MHRAEWAALRFKIYSLAKDSRWKLRLNSTNASTKNAGGGGGYGAGWRLGLKCEDLYTNYGLQVACRKDCHWNGRVWLFKLPHKISTDALGVYNSLSIRVECPREDFSG